MRRLQIYIDTTLDEALGREADRRGVSKAAVIRAALARELNGADQPAAKDGWESLIGWLDSEPVDDIDAVIYDHKA